LALLIEEGGVNNIMEYGDEVSPEEALEYYIKAGRIAYRVLNETIRLVKPGIRVLELCEFSERKIKEYGGKPAFPTNISINNVAAHYTSPIGDNTIVPEDGVVKVDIGVQVNGFIADIAKTVTLNPNYEDMVEAVEAALENALTIAKPGIRISELSKVIEETIKRYGYKPIRNLSGHEVKRYSLHAGTSIPNVKTFSLEKLKPWHTYAIEPFATNGAGYVRDSKEIYIYSLRKVRKPQSKIEEKIISKVKSEYKWLPFSERWLTELAEPNTLRKTLKSLTRRGILQGYPVLIEGLNGIVVQAEHTILVTDKDIIVITKP